MKGLIVLNGEPPSKEVFLKQIEIADLVLSADGATKTFTKYNRSPDLIIGDLDSIDEGELESFSVKSKIVKIRDQNRTDGEKAVKYCQEQGITDIVIVGALGKRLDHELYNLGLLRFSPELNITLIYKLGKILLLRDQIILQEKLNTTISLIPAFGPVVGVHAKGLVFPVNNVDMELGVFASISNVTKEKKVVISIKKGILLVCINSIHA